MSSLAGPTLFPVDAEEIEMGLSDVAAALGFVDETAGRVEFLWEHPDRRTEEAVLLAVGGLVEVLPIFRLAWDRLCGMRDELRGIIRKGRPE